MSSARRRPIASPHGTRVTAVRLALLLSVAMTAGCATLPSSGPTARQVTRMARDQAGIPDLHIVEIDSAAIATVERASVAAEPGLAALESTGDVDTVGPGDILQIAVYEVGVSLFGGGAASTATTEGTAAPAARDAGISNVVVDRDGAITLPYVGRLQVAGLAPPAIQTLIERGLRKYSQSPQVIVNVRENVANTVVVMGEVQKPGRLPLTLARPRLLDAIALAGGTAQPQSMVVRFTRAGRSAEQPLEAIVAGSRQDLALLPGDRIQLIRAPRTFTVFGATNKVSQIAFESSSVSLAEAIARAGGPSDGSADPSAVFLFRYDAAAAPAATAPAPGERALPTIYRLNMLNPSSYFLAQRFSMRDKDVIYIANAAANQPTKLIQVINLLFSPFFTVRAATRN